MPFLKCLTKGQSQYKIQFEISTNPLTFNFAVYSEVKPNISALNGKSIWGLWDTDVVEVFLQPRSHKMQFESTYWEFQLSPANQQFFLEITEPRKNFYSPLDIEWSSDTSIDHNQWTAKFCFNDQRLNDYDHLYFGAFAILGRENRQFFSYSPSDEIIDYHRPKLFHSLSNLPTDI